MSRTNSVDINLNYINHDILALVFKKTKHDLFQEIAEFNQQQK